MSLPPLSPLTLATLTSTLATLFEPSPALHALLVPTVLARLTAPPSSYTALISICADAATAWSYEEKADFISGHPLIGEVGNLSALSAKEQASKVTPAVVLQRLAHLNVLYSAAFPGLRYITFVNGRPRAAIVNEIEAAVGVPLSPVPLPDDYPVATPSVEEVAALRRDPAGDEWKAECDRAIGDVWRIGVARVHGMGLE